MTSLPFSMKPGGNSAEVDVKVFGAKLQSLLKIPPIEKTVNQSTPTNNASLAKQPIQTPVSSSPNSSINRPTLNTKMTGQKLHSPDIHRNDISGNSPTKVIKRPVPGPRKQNHESMRERPLLNSSPRLITAKDKDNRRIESPIKIARRPRNEITEKPGNNIQGQKNVNNKYDNSRNTAGNARQEVEGPHQDVKQSVRVSPLRQLLCKEECPLDIRNAGETLIDATIGEQRPTHCLNLNEEVLQLFKNHHIEPLKKRSPKFTRAKYHCSICNYHMDAIYNVVSHIINLRHFLNARRQQIVELLQLICPPSVDHLNALTNHVMSVWTTCGISNHEINERQAIVDRLGEIIKQCGINCELALFGSSASGFGFMNSDVNINANPTTEKGTDQLDGVDQTEILSQLFRALNKVPFCSDVMESFSSKAVSLRFTDSFTGKNCIIHVNNSSGVMLAKLFSEYDKCDQRVRPLVTMFRHFAKVAQIDNQNDGMLPSHCYSILTIHFLQARGVLPILHDLLGIKVDNAPTFSSAKDASLIWKTANKESIGSLWLGLLKYYAIEFLAKEEVVTISQSNLRRNSDNNWNRKLSIQDPILQRSNISRSLCSNKICDYIVDRIKIAYRYFAIPRTQGGALYDGIIPLSEADTKQIFYETLDVSNPRDVWQQERIRVRKIRGIDFKGHQRILVIKEDATLLHTVLNMNQYYFKLDQNIVQEDGEKPPKICKSCGQEDHLKRDCPEETVPILKPVRMPSYMTLKILSSVMFKNYQNEALDDNDVRIRQRICAEIHESLHSSFPDLDLSMFGSTYNGFGLHLSDVDICLQFKEKPINKATITQDEVNNILAIIVDRLKSYGSMQNILAIPSAKVPIVKFTHRGSHLEGDISLSNILALHNTRMLRTYCAIDGRLKIMGCFLKRVTKLCDISDASKGSLSSYGFVLMLIHFLQQHQPPVLPVLQELPRKPLMIEGCDVSFFEDLQNLGNVWPYYGKNQQSAAELWLAFTRYYTEFFNFEEHVIQIAQMKCKTRISKLWLTDTIIAIEDPFDKSHNLGAGLSRRMGVHIIKAFQRFRESFHMSVDNVKTKDWMDFFLSPRRVRGNTNPPVDRQCRICNRIGHFAKRCTYAKKFGDQPLSYFENGDADIEDDVEEQEPEPLSLEDELKRVVQIEDTKQMEYDKAKQQMLNSDKQVASLPNGLNESDKNCVQSLIADFGVLQTPSFGLDVDSQRSSTVDLEKEAGGIHFFGGGNTSENGILKQMISHNNSGVVFELPPKTSESPRFLNNEPPASNRSIPPIGTRHPNMSSMPYSSFAPPPGFVGPSCNSGSTANSGMGQESQQDSNLPMVGLPLVGMMYQNHPSSSSVMVPPPPPGFPSLRPMGSAIQNPITQPHAMGNRFPPAYSQMPMVGQGPQGYSHFPAFFRQLAPSAGHGSYPTQQDMREPEQNSDARSNNEQLLNGPSNFHQGIQKSISAQALASNEPEQVMQTANHNSNDKGGLNNFPLMTTNLRQMGDGNPTGNVYLPSHIHRHNSLQSLVSAGQANQGPQPMIPPQYHSVAYQPYPNPNYYPSPYAFHHYPQMHQYGFPTGNYSMQTGGAHYNDQDTSGAPERNEVRNNCEQVENKEN